MDNRCFIRGMKRENNTGILKIDITDVVLARCNFTEQTQFLFSSLYLDFARVHGSDSYYFYLLDIYLYLLRVI